MSCKERIEYPKDEDRKEAGDSNTPQSPSTSDTSLPRVPQSPTCRKIFFSEPIKAAPFPEVSKEVMEQQKLKWNFDFQSETPLEGRYLWIRTEESSGYYKNGKGAPSEKTPCRTVIQRKASKRSHQSVSPESEPEKTESGVSCDTSLNEPRESTSKSLRFNEPRLGVDWT